MKRTLCILALLLLPVVSVAQAAKLKMPDFSGLAEKARESVDITLDGDMLKSAGNFLGRGPAANEADLQQILTGLEGIYVKVFSFDQPNLYSMRDVESVIEQTKSRGWKKLMSIRDEGDRVEMWIRERDRGGGFLLVAAEAKELVIVNIAGNVDLEKLRRLQGRMGMPNFPGMAPPPAAPAAPPAATAPPAPSTR